MTSDNSALLVAHGSPSDPAGQEAALAALAAKVQALAPGWRVGAATLAAEGAFDRAVAQLGRPLIYPYFMAEGYFTRRVLAPKSAALSLTQAAPFGVEPALIGVAATRLAEVVAAQGWAASETQLLIAAHGSAVSKRSKDSAYAFAEALKNAVGFASANVGLIEEPPYLAEVAKGMGRAVCLPFFALSSGHIEQDVPEALANAGFCGPVLPPFIDWPETPALIARHLLAR
ncbi:CbiX/SirB N-terminal domain-containing protein [Vannielia sp.]|uniref:CbiX/SirB N-terminal domain-containing protein n=1 Tax=Vannielia sp. TaxID=2813045 RepID=UPI0026373E5C|nr:CbiX/SirB N-terminal domain-containing protein [Vannielia sp.]MDF1872513.1 CbiX/SirB N-terminal domain-containing protein [Vannielia sp.]